MELRNGVHKYKTYFQAEIDYIHIYPAVNTIFFLICMQIHAHAGSQGIHIPLQPEFQQRQLPQLAALNTG
uniref:hypothetical protein n=1 Tax=Thiolapillus sp. TaxID=2017437 RepID=UPI0025D1EB5B